jgi:ABC-2 type transport system permease protein
MLNLLRSDFYKLKRSKSYYICLGIIALFVAYIISDFSSSKHIKEELSPSTFHWIYMLFQERAFLPYFVPLLQSIFITMLITTEYATGTIKDPVSLGFSRSKIYLSKLSMVSLATIFMLLLAIIVSGLTSILVFGFYGTFTFLDMLLFIRMFLIQIVLYTAYASLFLLISFLIKNIGGTMAFTIIFSLVLGSLASMVGNSLIGRILLIMNFSPTALPHPSQTDLMLAMVVAISYLILTTGIGLYIFNKRDIK